MISIETTLSSSSIFIDLTPNDFLPVSLISLTLNLIHFPNAETNIASSSSSAILTSISSSPSLRAVAILPFFMMLSYSLRSVFFTRPFFVANKSFPVCPFALGMIALTFSSASTGIRLTTARPFACF